VEVPLAVSLLDSGYGMSETEDWNISMLAVLAVFAVLGGRAIQTPSRRFMLFRNPSSRDILN
jgi:hypothetical protein